MLEYSDVLFLFGHIHNGGFTGGCPRNGYNVGVDVNGFKPVSLEEIRERVGM
jgi:calcineurin-like phosphoesterase family protein